MAYFHCIHSTRVNGCSEGRDVVLHWPRRQQRRQMRVGTSRRVSSLVRRRRETQACWTCSWSLSSWKVLRGGHRYSSSKAWCRAMRSEWLETLQKGMACWEGQTQVSTEQAPRPALLRSPVGAHPCSQGCEDCQLGPQCHLCVKRKLRLSPPLRIPGCIEKRNLESVSFKKLMDIS